MIERRTLVLPFGLWYRYTRISPRDFWIISASLITAALFYLATGVADTFANEADSQVGASPNASTSITRSSGGGGDTMSLGSTLFYDVDDSGTLDGGETGIPGIQVNLYDVSNTFVVSDTTDATGNYHLTGLSPGNYFIIIQDPPRDATTSSTPSNLNDDQVDNDDNGQQPGGPGAPVISPIISLTAGDEPTGETGPGGDQDAANDSDGDMTVDFGFLPVEFGVTVGDRVWEDSNRNGLQDAGEPGIPGVSVFIFDANTGGPVTDDRGEPLTDVTDADGLYLFEELPPGNYYVLLNNLPDERYEVTERNAGDDDTIDSDGYPILLQTSTTGPLSDGAQHRDLDVGFIRDVTTASVGDYVWYDFDGDGVQGTSSDEYGLEAVTVTLFDATETLIATTRTDANGTYSFVNIEPGTYFLAVTAPNGLLIPVWPGQSNNDELDSDIIVSALRTPLFALEAGDTDLSWDIGFALASTIRTNFWIDSDENGLFEEGDEAVPNAAIELLDETGSVVSNAVTDADGIAQFTVPPGRYRLRFVAPEEYGFTVQNANGPINSDVDTKGFTDFITLNPGEEITSLGAGIFFQGPTSLVGDEEPTTHELQIFIPFLLE